MKKDKIYTKVIKDLDYLIDLGVDDEIVNDLIVYIVDFAEQLKNKNNGQQVKKTYINSSIIRFFSVIQDFILFDNIYLNVKVLLKIVLEVI